MTRPDPDKVFATSEEAHRAADRLNLQPIEWGYSPWYVGGPVEEEWWVVRARQVIAEDLDVEARDFEEAYLAAVAEQAKGR